MAVAPVVQIPTEAAQPGAEGAEGQPAYSGMVVSRVIPLADGVILEGTLTVELESGLTVNIFNGFLEDVTIQDANNIVLTPLTVPADFIVESNEAGSDMYHWAMQINATSHCLAVDNHGQLHPAVREPYAILPLSR